MGVKPDGCGFITTTSTDDVHPVWFKFLVGRDLEANATVQKWYSNTALQVVDTAGA